MRSDGRITRQVVAGAAFAAATIVLAACSPGDYPAVLDKPPPRADTMSPDQVKQATDALISDRDHLSAEVGASQPNGAAGTTGRIGTATVQPASATTGTRTAGAAAKP